MINKKDFWIILGILLISGSFLWYSQQSLDFVQVTAEVYVEDSLVMQLPLDQAHQGVYQVPNQDVQLEVNHEGIRFSHSNCSDQICVHTGWLKRAGSVAACLPNKVVVRVVSTGSVDQTVNSAEQPDVVIGR